MEEKRFADGELAFSAYELETREVLQDRIEVLHPIAFPVDFDYQLELLG